jgi:phage terminase small subunit
MARKLTSKQEAYKNNRIKGMGVSESYRAAYSCKTMTDRNVSVEANKLENDPRIAPDVKVKRKEATERALITTEDLVKMLLVEAQSCDDGSTHGARVSAIKLLTDFTGGFDKNRQKIDQRNVDMTHEQWLDSLND